MGERSSESTSPKDKSKVDYEYKWLEKNRRDFALSQDDTYYSNDSVYDYQVWKKRKAQLQEKRKWKTEKEKLTKERSMTQEIF